MPIDFVSSTWAATHIIATKPCIYGGFIAIRHQCKTDARLREKIDSSMKECS
jgi:hypothetical protein